MKKRQFLLLNIALVATMGATSAEEISADDIYSIDNVVVTATGTPRLLKETPESIQVITATEIKRTNATTLNDALERLTSSITTHTNGMGTYVNFNGVEDDYFIFLENGRKISGDNIFSRIDLSRVKRIEVMSGAASTLYGSNAIGGVINIITYEGEPQTKVSATSTTSYNGYGRFTQAINADVTVGRLTSQTSYRYQKSDSWQLNDQTVDSDGVYSDTTDDAFDGFANNLLNQQFYYRVNDKLELSAYGSLYDNMSDRTYDYHYYNLHHENYGAGAGATYKASDKSTIVAEFTSGNYASSYEYFKDYSKTGKEVGDIDLQNRKIYNNLDVKGIFALSDKNRLSVGAEYTLNTLHDPGDEINYLTEYTIAAYAQDEISLSDKLQATIGVRYTNDEAFDHNITQNASLAYTLNKLRFRATYATAYLTPTQYDRFCSSYISSTDIYTRANENLNPETSVYFSFGAEYSSKRFSLSSSIFHNKINDMIGYRDLDINDVTQAEIDDNGPIEELRERSNITRAEVVGVNVNAIAQIGAGFTLKANYTYLDTFDFDSRAQIDKTVKHTAIFSANWSKQWSDYLLNVNLNGQYNSSMYSSFYDGVEGEIPSYTLWDITTSHRFNLKNGFVIEPVVGVQNIFDYTDDRPINSYYATLTPGRSLYLCLNLRF